MRATIALVTVLLLGALIVPTTVARHVQAKPCHGHACPSPSPVPTAAPTASPSPSPSPSPTPIPTSTPNPNVKRLLVMLVNFSDDVRQPWTTDFVSQIYNGGVMFSVADFYQQTSWGQVTVTADVVGWYVLQTSLAVDGCQGATKVKPQAEAAAIADGIDLSAYTNEVFIWPGNDTCLYAGTGEQPGRYVWVNLPGPCSVTDGCRQQFHIFAHEFGHNFGLGHAGTYTCAPVVLSDTCTSTSLGDQFDIMGCCSKSLFSNIHRIQAGWLPASRIVDVTTSQTITVRPAYDQASSVYRLPLGAGQFLYLENRADSSSVYDSGINYSQTGNLLIRRAPDVTNPATTGLLDGSPENTPTLAKALPVGSSFTYGTLTVTNVSWDGTDNVVEVVR